MLRLRLSAAALAASFALAGLAFSAPASAHSSHHLHRHHHGRVIIEQFGDAYSSYGDYEDETYPNTVDHSAECINGYRWQRHNHDWYKTTGQDTLPLPCH